MITEHWDTSGKIIVYGDIACGIIGLVLKDIPEMYNVIFKDSELSKLSISDWITASLILATPVIVDTTSTDEPPLKPVGVYVIHSIVKRVFEKALSELDIAGSQKLKLRMIMEKIYIVIVGM